MEVLDRNKKCKRCSLHKEAQSVCLWGQGPKKCKVMFIGEAPGYREDEINKPFQGKAGQLLDSYLKDVGLDRSDIYITNVCKCRPPSNRTPTKKEIKECRPYLWKEILTVRPDYLVLLGNTALQGVMGYSGIKEARGKWVEVEELKILPTYHPAAILRNPNLAPRMKSDLQKLALVLDGGSTLENDIPFTFCKTKEDLKAYLKAARKAVDHSYDVETIPDTDIVLCMASTFELKDGSTSSWFIPLAHPQSPFRRKWKTVMQYIAPTIERQEPFTCFTTAQNGKFDNKKFRVNVKCNPRLTFDTMLGSHLIDENTPHDLGYLSATWAGAPSYKEEVDNTKLAETDIWKVAVYNVGDTFYTLGVKKQLKKKLKEDGRLFKIFKYCTMPAARAMEQGELRGFYLDQKQLHHMIGVALKNMWDALQKVAEFLPGGYELETCVNCRRRLADKRLQPCPTPEMIKEGYRCKKYSEPKGLQTFNINSSQQMGWLMFDHLEIEPVEYTDAGKPSTAEDSLVYMKHDIIKHLLDYREWEKLWTTYLRPWSEMVDEKGRIYTSFLLHGTVTGRWSSRKPNIQNVPRNPEIRKIISSPPGWKFVECDLSQIELRGVAHCAPEPTMLRIYQTNGDIHVETACVITGKTPDQVTKDDRKKAKAVNFGFVYGMGWKKFMKYAKEKYDVEFTEKEAKTIRKRFFDKYKGLKPWHDRQKRIVKSLGFVRSPLGRKRRLPEINSPEDGIRAEAERQSVNSPIQAIPPDITMMALGTLEDMPGMWEECYCIGQVHDALLFEVREDVVDKWAPIIKAAMEDTEKIERIFGVEFQVPIIAEVTVGEAWGQGKEWHPA